MSSESNDWAELVVDSGEHGSCVGLLENAASGYALRAMPQSLARKPDSDPGWDLFEIPIRMNLTSPKGLGEGVGSWVRIEGVRESNGLLVDQWSRLTPQPPVEERSIRHEVGQRPTSFLDRKVSVPQRSEAEQQLLKSGQLIDIWLDRNNEGRQWVALATDPQAVRDVLSETYGKSLLIVRSKWTAHLLTSVEKVVRRDPCIRSFGNEVNSEKQLVATATLTFLSSGLAERLSYFRPDSYALRVLVVPSMPAR